MQVNEDDVEKPVLEYESKVVRWNPRAFDWAVWIAMFVGWFFGFFLGVRLFDRLDHQLSIFIDDPVIIVTYFGSVASCVVFRFTLLTIAARRFRMTWKKIPFALIGSFAIGVVWGLILLPVLIKPLAPNL